MLHIRYVPRWSDDSCAMSWLNSMRSCSEMEEAERLRLLLLDLILVNFFSKALDRISVCPCVTVCVTR